MPQIATKCCRIFKTLSSLGQRPISTSPKRLHSDLTILNVNDKSGVATLTMNRPPINALNGPLLSAIRADLEQTKKNNCRGLILTSSLQNVFCGGLDLTELYNPDKDRLTALWRTMQDVALGLSTHPAPVVALLNGHAPAGGCVLAISCKYRVMLPNFTIGLNETALGIVAPKWIMATLLEILPRRVAELALTRSTLFRSDEALSVGLVDEVVNDKDKGLESCESFSKQFAKVDPSARAETKKQFRYNLLAGGNRSDGFVEFALQPNVQKIIGDYLQSLKNKKK